MNNDNQLKLGKVLIGHLKKSYNENCGGTTNSIAVRIDNTDEQKLVTWANDNDVSSDMFDTYYHDMEECEELAIFLVDDNTQYEDVGGEKITFNDLEPGSVVNLTAHAWQPKRQLYINSDRTKLCVVDNIKVVRK